MTEQLWKEWLHLIGTGIPATVAYFAVGIVVLVLGFVTLDLLTPGKLRDLVFVENRAGAALMAAANQIALVLVIASAIINSDNRLAVGLLDVVVYGIVGIVMQASALMVLEAAIPGRFRDVVMDAKVRPRASLAAITMVGVGVINALALS